MPKPPFTSRRRLLQTGLAFAAGAALPRAFAVENNSPRDGRLLVVFLRGGLDGLFAFAPVADPNLPSMRPGLSREVLASGIALGRSGFAAHPACRCSCRCC